MEVRTKEGYIEVDLSQEDWDNIKKGRYPSKRVSINDEPITVSVGLVR